MEHRIKQFFDWMLCGHISDLEYQLKIYKEQLSLQREKTHRCRQEQIQRVNKLVHDNNEMMLKIKAYREKEERIKEQKREWKERQKNK